jgi:hydrogenase expression/formation protein HypE
MKPNLSTVLLDHGAGGRAAHELVARVFLKHLAGQNGSSLEDSAVLDFPPGRLAFTTDSFVVTPLFFPGGDIGDLAVNGTVNDLVMRGARPLYLSAGFILEEGLPIDTLDRIVASMARAADRAGVRVVAGDTKVVPKGAADRVFINTAGVGVVPDGREISASRAKPGDRILISGTLGDHGLAVLCQRSGLELDTPIVSDTASLAGLVERLIVIGQGDIHVLRDPTRGGLGTTLNEIAQSSGVGMLLYEDRLPVRPEVRGACDILGLDPLYVANEGKVIVIAAAGAAEALLAALKADDLGRDAALIGEVTDVRPGQVFLRTMIGGTRVVDMLTGEQLPRIC